MLYLVQSKWSAGGNHNLGTDDIRTLVDGLRKLQTWKDLHPANPIRNFRSEVWDNGVKVPGVKFVLVWATSGENQPSDGVQKYAKQKISASAIGRGGGTDPVPEAKQPASRLRGAGRVHAQQD